MNNINIDTVYQKVLSLANKEQRGYITPQEFNLFADQAQLEIFEQYFYDLNQFSRSNRSSEEYANITKFIEEKLSRFKLMSGNTSNGGIVTDSAYQLGTVWSDTEVVCEEIEYEKLLYLQKSRLLSPTIFYPVYTKIRNIINIYPSSIPSFKYEYIKKPAKPSWTFVVVNSKAMYDPDNASLSHFDLHPSEESEIVYKILKYAGISIKQQDIVQNAQGMETINIQQQKQ